VRIAKTPGGLWLACVFSLIGAVLSLEVLSAAVALHLFITFVAAATWLFFRLNRRFVTALLIAAPFVAYGTIVYFDACALERFAVARQKYPMESIAARLGYEHKPDRLPKTAPSAAPVLSVTTSAQLAQSEEVDSFNWRVRALRNLHDGTTRQFIMAEGFGPARMIGVMAARFDPSGDVVGPISLKSQPAKPSALPSDASNSAAQAMAVGATPTNELLESLHWAGQSDFLDSGQMGYVQDRDHVMGFQSHHFTKMPIASDDSLLKSWRIARLELIGLLKYDEPRAYISENLPRLQDLGKAATRGLDEFETAALKRLRTQEDVVIDESPSRIRMLGSLRASKTCIQCHDVQRGELLGALSYELLPLKAKSATPRSDTVTMERR
jgi:hypothetical protein